MTTLRSVTTTTAIAGACTLALAACGGGTEQSADETVADMMADAASNAPSFDDGYDVCFKAAQAALGDDAMVSTIATLFSSGSDIDSMQSYPRGTMTGCKVEYQDPDNPMAMLSMDYDNNEGGFGEARELEITVIGGDASEFRVEDYVVRLGDVNIAAIGTMMEAKKADLDAAYSDYAWTGVRLDSPGVTSLDHALNITLTGRLASNNVKETGSARIGIDGTTVIRDGLLP